MLRKTALDLPPAEVLREYLSYDAETGILRWRKRGQPSHQHLVGKEALSSPTSRGYKRGGLFGRNVMAHRVGEVTFWNQYKRAHGQTVEQLIDELCAASPKRREISDIRKERERG